MTKWRIDEEVQAYYRWCARDEYTLRGNRYGQVNQIGRLVIAARKVCVEHNRMYSFVCPFCGGTARAYVETNGRLHVGCSCCSDFLDLPI